MRPVLRLTIFTQPVGTDCSLCAWSALGFDAAAGLVGDCAVDCDDETGVKRNAWVCPAGFLPLPTIWPWSLMAAAIERCQPEAGSIMVFRSVIVAIAEEKCGMPAILVIRAAHNLPGVIDTVSLVAFASDCPEVLHPFAGLPKEGVMVAVFCRRGSAPRPAQLC